MKRGQKVVLLGFSLFLITGCSANYNVEIYNEKVTINGKILEKDKSKWDKEVIVTETSGFESLTPDVYKNLLDGDEKFTYRQLVNKQFSLDETVQKLEGLSKINNPWQLGLKYKRGYKLYGEKDNSFIKAAGTTYCYDNFNITEDEENENIIISTSVKNNCFDIYSNLDSITVNVKTNHKVVDSTADSVNKDTYTWKLTRDNSSNKPIQITLKKDEYVFNYDNRIIKLVGLALIIAFLVVFFYKIGIIVYNFRYKTRNSI